MKYQANPIIVDAFIILRTGLHPDVADILPDGSMRLLLQDGRDVVATAEMIARYIPHEGDYWVIQEDGYIYINPKAVFERKYSPIAQPRMLKQPQPLRESRLDV